MATSLEEPGHSRAIHILNQALSFRNLTPPKSNLPLTIPFLAHTSFQAGIQRWLAQLLNHHKHFAIPLHLPMSCAPKAVKVPANETGIIRIVLSVRPSENLLPATDCKATGNSGEAAHPTLRSRLRNHRRWEDLLGNSPELDQLPCGCHHLRNLLLHKEAAPLDEHLIVTLADLQLPAHLRRFLNANMNSAFVPTKQRFTDTFRHSLIKWLRHHGLPTTLSYHADSFLTPQWNKHQLHLQHEDRFTARSIKQLQEFLGDKVVLHHADHELQHLRLFCPKIYFRGCLATWQSPELFQPLPDDTDQTISNIIQQAFPAHLRKKYKWGFNPKFNMPYGVVHLKAKKQWRKGRPIVSYFKSYYGPLLRVTSNILNTMIHRSCRNHQDSSPSHNYGTTSTTTSTTHQILWTFTQSTTTWSASSTPSPKIA